jgi:hypothetical protein
LWTVPRIIGGSHNAYAATWIGAQSPGGNHAPFIQVGINEQRLPFGSLYYAFYSDTKLSFHPHPLFIVRPGDRIAAHLRLASGHWHVLIVDHTHPHKVAFRTADDADTAFNQAEWLQEDVSFSLKLGHVFPYPVLSTVGFHRVRVDSRPPRYARIRSQWMSENGDDLAPNPLVGDAFSLAPTQPTAIGLHYVQIAVALDVALRSFEADFARWNAHTPAWEIASQRAAAVEAFKLETLEVTATQWPAGAQRLCNELVAATNREIAQTNRVPPRTLGGRLRWLADWLRADSTTVAISLRIRRVLNLPQLFPLPAPSR